MVKKLGTLVNKESEVIHSPFNGEKIMGREALSAKVKLEDGVWHEVKLHSYSPFGIEFVNEGFNFKQGEPITVRIKLAGDETEFSGLVVTSVHEGNGVRLAGVRTFIKNKLEQSEYSGSDRRSHIRWNCSEDFLPTGTAPNPVKYNDYILFRVEDISKGGLKIITSMRNKFVGIGQRLECTLSLPYVGTVRVDVKVRHVNTTFYRGKEFMVVGTEFIKTDPILLRSLGEYLLNFAKDVTVKSLNSDGFGIKNVSKWLDFSYVKTEEEYKEVLELRCKAYTSSGKVDSSTQPHEMADEFDSKAKIIIAKYNGKIVGTIRCIFPTKDTEIELSTEPVAKEKIFHHNVNEVVEASRLSVDENFRGIDVKFEVLAYMILTTIQGNRRYIYTAAHSQVLDFYKNMGFRDMDLSFPAKNLNKLTHHFIILDTHKASLGENTTIKAWFKIYNNLYNFLVSNNLIEPSPLDAVKIKLYRTIGNILSKI